MRYLAAVLLAPALFAQEPTVNQIRSAATQSVALLQKGSAGFYKAQDCYSCHHARLPARVLQLARERGVTGRRGGCPCNAGQSPFLQPRPDFD